MAHIYVDQGEARVFDVNRSLLNEDVIWTNGLGCCIALALIGTNKKTQKYSFCFAHLSSKDYSPILKGGRVTNASKIVKDFVDEHKLIENKTKCATNHIHNLAIGEYINLRFQLGFPPTVRYLNNKSENGGVASLTVNHFSMYSSEPKYVSEKSNIKLLATTGGKNTGTSTKKKKEGCCVIL